MNKKEFTQKILLKAIKDKTFREKLIKNPKKVIEEELQIQLPKELQIEILEERENKQYLVIPQIEEPKILSDEELKTLAGGLGSREFGRCVNRSQDMHVCPVK